MVEKYQELESPTRTKEHVLSEKPRKRDRSTGATESVRSKKDHQKWETGYVKDPDEEPRIWFWLLTILFIIQVVGFCTCRPPSKGYEYRQRLFSYFLPLYKSAQARSRVLIKSIFQIMSRWIQGNLLSWVSKQWKVLQAQSRPLIKSALHSITKYIQEIILPWVSCQWGVLQAHLWPLIKSAVQLTTTYTQDTPYCPGYLVNRESCKTTTYGMSAHHVEPLHQSLQLS